METLKNVGNQVSETVQGATSTASKEANKSQSFYTVPYYVNNRSPTSDVAKDDQASLGTRAEATKDMVGDKVDEQKHEVCQLVPSLQHIH
ncbi:MAG: hypothetical protein Q9219_005200 [cf. Caloplaca sp. 3 TL-2023]